MTFESWKPGGEAPRDGRKVTSCSCVALTVACCACLEIAVDVSSLRALPPRLAPLSLRALGERSGATTGRTWGCQRFERKGQARATSATSANLLDFETRIARPRSRKVGARCASRTMAWRPCAVRRDTAGWGGLAGEVPWGRADWFPPGAQIVVRSARFAPRFRSDESARIPGLPAPGRPSRQNPLGLRPRG